MPEPEFEKCQRCRYNGRDRRTLIVSCFYELQELGIPFEEKPYFYTDLEQLERVKEPVVLNIPNGPEICIDPGTVKTGGELRPIGFYTLRFCKRCRADFLAALKNWYENAPVEPDDDSEVGNDEFSTGTGVYIRENGVNRELTEEEMKERFDCE